VRRFIQLDCYQGSQCRKVANDKIDCFRGNTVSPSLPTGIRLAISRKPEHLPKRHLGKNMARIANNVSQHPKEISFGVADEPLVHLHPRQVRKIRPPRIIPEEAQEKAKASRLLSHERYYTTGHRSGDEIGT